MNIKVTEVYRLQLDDGRYPSPSPFAAQQVDWGLIFAQQATEADFLKKRSERMTGLGSASDNAGLSPLWP